MTVQDNVLERLFRYEEEAMLVGAASVFTVRDIAASLACYRDALGFDVTFPIRRPDFLRLPLPRRGRAAPRGRARTGLGREA